MFVVLSVFVIIMC